LGKYGIVKTVAVEQLVSFSVDRLRFFADTPMTITDSSGATAYREPNF